ncbi:MAG TPA: hypothetical protein VG520_09515 [Candidatus Dormibacteraeota bacterium]|jgi:hypothetical protein|nr:hypothetical protein [Candidatus Dormibacteraeota bacterium]
MSFRSQSRLAVAVLSAAAAVAVVRYVRVTLAPLYQALGAAIEISLERDNGLFGGSLRRAMPPPDACGARGPELRAE